MDLPATKHIFWYFQGDQAATTCRNKGQRVYMLSQPWLWSDTSLSSAAPVNVFVISTDDLILFHDAGRSVIFSFGQSFPHFQIFFLICKTSSFFSLLLQQILTLLSYRFVPSPQWMVTVNLQPALSFSLKVASSLLLNDVHQPVSFSCTSSMVFIKLFTSLYGQSVFHLHWHFVL